MEVPTHLNGKGLDDEDDPARTMCPCIAQS